MTTAHQLRSRVKGQLSRPVLETSRSGDRVAQFNNSANGFIFYGKGGELATNNRADQELGLLALHLVQNCLVYINTLMLQEVLREPGWLDRMAPEDMRALTPLIYSHVNPYGTFRLNMDERLPLVEVAA